MPTAEDSRAVLSIDLGASYTKFAFRPAWTSANNQDWNHYTDSSQAQAIIPSLVLFRGNGDHVFGADAESGRPGVGDALVRDWKVKLFDPDCPNANLETARNAAQQFLQWLIDLFRESERLQPAELHACRLRICIPARGMPGADCGENRLRELIAQIKWKGPVVFETEPVANLIGFGTRGTNNCYYHQNTGRAYVRTGEMYPSWFRHYVERPFGIIDIGHFTTDVSVCHFDQNLDVRFERQESFRLGISQIDAQLRSTLQDRGLGDENMSQAEFRELKESVYSGQDYTRPVNGQLVQVGQGLMTGAISNFADLVAQTCWAHLDGCRWIALTGGGISIPTLEARLQQSLHQNGFEIFNRIQDNFDTRLATAIGGASVALDVGLDPDGARAPVDTPPVVGDPPSVDCSCNGLNPSCAKCDGSGRIIITSPNPRPNPSGAPQAPPRSTPEADLALPVNPAPARERFLKSKAFVELSPEDQNCLRRALQSPVPTAPLDFQKIVDAWNETEARNRFTLQGKLGGLIFPDLEDANQRRDRLRSVKTLDGLEAWYRLLCLGCSLSLPLGQVPYDRVSGFWEEELKSKHAFWEKTVPSTLDGDEIEQPERALDPVFDEIIHKTFEDIKSSGEDAHFWRRVFYDFRKMWTLVFHNRFPEFVLLVADHLETSADQLVSFLKAGEMPTHLGDRRWAGVIGQSMSAPLLFVMRELRFLGVLAEPRFDSLCYYMNSPARRVASKLGWIDSEDQRAYDFESLLATSETVCKRWDGNALKEFFDLPLQWYARQNPR